MSVNTITELSSKWWGGYSSALELSTLNSRESFWLSKKPRMSMIQGVFGGRFPMWEWTQPSKKLQPGSWQLCSLHLEKQMLSHFLQTTTNERLDDDSTLNNTFHSKICKYTQRIQKLEKEVKRSREKVML